MTPTPVARPLFPSPRSAQGFLALVILMGGILLVAGIALSFVVLSSVNSGFGYEASEQAQSVATAGAQDGLLQLDRNSNASSTGYTIAVGSSTATITITQSSPSSGYVTILSAATVLGNTRKASVVVSENSSTGQSSIVSWSNVQ
jgi:uncharacterized protein (UPF0333 family)